MSLAGPSVPGVPCSPLQTFGESTGPEPHDDCRSPVSGPCNDLWTSRSLPGFSVVGTQSLPSHSSVLPPLWTVPGEVRRHCFQTPVGTCSLRSSGSFRVLDPTDSYVHPPADGLPGGPCPLFKVKDLLDPWRLVPGVPTDLSSSPL